MKNLPVILLIGSSGSGKTTIAEFLNLRNGWTQIESYTTRKPRFDGERGHTFITDEEFDRLTDIVAYTDYNGYRYCATAQQIDDNQLYVVDVPGVETLLQNYKGGKEFVAVNISLSDTVRRERMAERGDSDAKIEERIANDKTDFDNAFARLVELLGEDRVVAMSLDSSAEIAAAIENYLYTKGYEWETI